MTTLACDYCGARFTRSRPARYPHSYCSKVCSNRANARSGTEHPNWKRIVLICPTCGESFTRAPSAVAEHWNCCSLECDAAYRRTITGDARYNYIDSPKLMTCEVCGTQKLVQHPSHQQRFRACSKRCACLLGHRRWPRTSSLETAMAEAFERAGLQPIASYPLDRATADFAFPDLRLIVECDGSYWHSLPEVAARDKRRDGWLRSKGWRTLRLSEANIKRDPDACVQRVQRVMRRQVRLAQPVAP